MKLTELNTTRGAPMGRRSYGTDLEDIKVELERMPLIDGGYSVDGAYWGSPDNLWAYQHTDADGETQMFGTLRARRREDAIAELAEENPTWVILPENGTVIAQTIEFLEGYVARERNVAVDDDDLERLGDTEDEISILEDELQRIRWHLIKVEVPLLGYDIVKDRETDSYRFAARFETVESGLFDTDWEAAMALVELHTEKP